MVHLFLHVFRFNFVIIGESNRATSSSFDAVHDPVPLIFEVDLKSLNMFGDTIWCFFTFFCIEWNSIVPGNCTAWSSFWKRRTVMVFVSNRIDQIAASSVRFATMKLRVEDSGGSYWSGPNERSGTGQTEGRAPGTWVELFWYQVGDQIYANWTPQTRKVVKG